MSTNLSKIKRDKMLDTISKIKENVNDEETLKNLSLIEYELSKTKYGIVWEEHEEEVDRKLKSNIPVFIDNKEREVIQDNNNNYNFILEGDNLHSLYLLEKTHRNKIDMIYIDPPYNTGAKDWRYNNDYVDGTDLYRHSKWLSLMNKRLEIAKKLLKEDGVICVTIDDYELPTLNLLMDKIFGEENRLGIVTIRNNPKGRMTKKKIAQVHEFALYYGKSDKSSIKKIPKNPEEKSHNYVLDENGNYYLKMNLRKQGVDSEAVKSDGTYRERYFPIYYDEKENRLSCTEKLPIEILPIDNKNFKRIWRRDKQTIEQMFEDGELFVEKVKDRYQVFFRFRGGLDGEQPKSIWYDSTFSASEYGTSTLENILGGREKFPYPKSLPAVIHSIRVGTDNKNAVILDFFAGSGTTGQAVLELNKGDNGNRKFILCTNNDNNICEEVTYPRIKTVITGKRQDGSKYSDGFDINLKYYKTDYIPRLNTDEENIQENLLVNIKNLIQLENGISVDNEKIRVILDEEEIDTFSVNLEEVKKCNKLYISTDILLTAKQVKTFKDNNVEVYVIPEYYFEKEIKEVQ